MQTLSRKEKSVKSLIEMGQNGHYPLFDSLWVYECFAQEESKQKGRPLSQKDKVRARKILQRLLAHRSFDRQKTALLALSSEERLLFLKTFFQMVEGKILDSGPQLH